jgi:cytoskeletal protein CcmA (bactofilin family)
MLPKLGKALGAVSHAAHSGSRNANGGLPLSVIGSDVKIVGNIITQGEMQIDGQVEGDISCARLLVGEGGRITGEVTAESVHVHGELTGRINAGAVIIARSAKVVGDVTQETIEIEAGASIEGRVIRRESLLKALEAPAEGHAPAKGNGAAEPAQIAGPASSAGKKGPDLAQDPAAGNA